MGNTGVQEQILWNRKIEAVGVEIKIFVALEMGKTVFLPGTDILYVGK